MPEHDVLEDTWLPTREAMAYIGVKRPESIPMFVNLRPAAAPDQRTKRVRMDKRGGRNYYYRPDLDDYMEFKVAQMRKDAVLRLHKAVRVCAECGERWPCEATRRALA